MNKKGISLVALVITIIVLIILTAAVIITGVNAPSNAQSAVNSYNVAVVQDAVTIYVMNEIAAYSSDNTKGSADVATAVGKIATSNKLTVASKALLGLTNISDTEIVKYSVTDKGVVSYQ